MTTKELIDQIRKKKSFLCIGLDVDIQKIPPHLLKTADPIFEFNKAIINATHHLCPQELILQKYTKLSLKPDTYQ